jgi:uncharacterized membrane protein
MTNRAIAAISTRVAPIRFVVFGAVLFVVTAAASAWGADLRMAVVIGFDVAAFVFLGTVVPLLRFDADAMRRAAKANDANRVAVLAITVLVSLVIFIAIGTLIAGPGQLPNAEVALIVATLALVWIFANTVFTLHYAHLFYLQADGGDRRGLEVPRATHPDYWDFLYFSFTLGMTFQTSDIVIDGPHMRKVALAHGIVAFIFNMGVLGFTVNALGGLR